MRGSVLAMSADFWAPYGEHCRVFWGGRGGSEQHSKKANHLAVRISATGAKTAGYRTDEKSDRSKRCE